MQLSVLNQAFRRLGIAGDAAENHGILCGLLCARGEVDEEEWVALMIADAPAGGAGGAIIRPSFAAGSAPMSMNEERALLNDLYEATVRDLGAPDLVFMPLLPDDSEPLGRRAEAVSDWCRGFLYGLGVGGIEDHETMPEDMREIIADIIEISRASSETDESEEDEHAFMELVEYLRAGVTLVYETLDVGRRGDADRPVLH